VTGERIDGQRIDAPPSVAELGEVLADVVQALRVAWPPADELLPGSRVEQAAYEAAAMRSVTELVLPFLEEAATLSYVALELRCDQLMAEVRLRARAAQRGILDSRSGDGDA
jgi:hypothetical protein